MTTEATVLAAEEDLDSMLLFGVAHFSALAVTVVVTAVLLAVVRLHRDSPAVGRAITLAGWLMLLVGVGWIIWDLLPGRFDPAQAVPVNLSDWARIIIPLALITRASWAVAVAYYWGLTLNLMALLTPDLNYRFSPPVEYAMFWLSHIAAFIAPVILVWGLGLRPTWRGAGFALLGRSGVWGQPGHRGELRVSPARPTGWFAIRSDGPVAGLHLRGGGRGRRRAQ